MLLEQRLETFDTLEAYYHSYGLLRWPVVYVLPFWLRAWWEAYAEPNTEALLLSFHDGDGLFGLAPLYKCSGGAARFIGSASVCDYLDFISAPGRGEAFLGTLAAALTERDISALELESQRPDSLVFRILAEYGSPPGWRATFTRETLAFAVPSRPSWEAYLTALSKKQRHEVRRRLRRFFEDAPGYRYRVLASPADLAAFTPVFLELMRQNPEKEEFLDSVTAAYFHRLILSSGQAGVGRFGVLEIDGKVVAAVLYFDYEGRVYLYNSGYRSEAASLGVGFICKVLCLRDSFNRGAGVFDFLKGDEVYKSRLGARGVPVYRVTLRKV